MRRSSLPNRNTLRLGYEVPRIFTPPLRPLTPETSHGFSCIRFAEEVLGITLMPWQKWLLIHALELRPDGLYRFRTVIVLVARQNGKTLVMQILALWHLYIKASRTVIGTAQDINNAEKAWADTLDMAREVPDLAVEIESVVRGTSKKAFSLKSKETYHVAAASRRGARGKSGDLVLLDELREHQSWDSWAAATKTTLARPKSQVWCFSNAGDFLSIVLRFMRALAHQALGWPDGDGDKDALDLAQDLDEDDEDLEDGDSLGLFEWSMKPGLPKNDRDGWAQANPSLNHTEVVEDVITERAIASAMRTDPNHVFEVEVLCRWLSSLGGGPYPIGLWSKGTDNSSSIAEGSKIGACVDVSWDRTVAHIAFCGFREDGGRHVEIVATRAGTDWVKPWLRKRLGTFQAIAVQANGAPASSLIDALSEVDDDENPIFPLVPWEGAELGRSFGQFYDLVAHQVLTDDGKLVAEPGIWHTTQPVLDVAATTAVARRSGDALMIDRQRSPMDAAPLVAANGANWVLDQIPEEEPESVYESRSLFIV